MEFKLVTERAHLYCPNVNVCFMAELGRAYEMDKIHEAVNKTVLKHPILRSCVRMEQDGGAFLYAEEHAMPELYIEPLPSEDSWLAVIAREQEKPFDLSKAPLMRFTCLIDDNRILLVMCLHHILADGRSGLSLMGDILYFLKHPDETVTVKQGALLEDTDLYRGEMLSLPIRMLTVLLNRRWRKAPRVFSGVEYEVMRQTYWRRKSHTIGAASLDMNQTNKLVNLCREHSVTVNSLLMTTLIDSAQTVSGNARENKKAGFAVRIRPNDHAIGNFASGATVEYIFNNRKTVWENTTYVQALIMKKLDNDRKKYFYLTFMKALDNGLIDSMYFRLFGGFENSASDILGNILGNIPAPKGSGITNLGKSGLSVNDGIKALYFVPPLVPSTDKIVGAVTTDTGLKLVYQYDNQNAETSRKVFEHWIAKLQNLSI